MCPCGCSPEPNGARLRSQELARGSKSTEPCLSPHSPGALNTFRVMHHCSSGADQLGKEAEGLWLAGSSEPMCSCVLTLFCSFAIVCSDFWLCVQAFPSVLKLPKRLPMCAKSNSQHKDSHLLSANKRSPYRGKEQLSGISQRCFVGILWVCKCSAGRLSPV